MNTLTRAALAQFSGSELWHRHGLNPRVLFTDGAKHVADAGGAYWLLDEIALAQLHVSCVKPEDFQVWTLAVQHDRSATLTCGDGNGRIILRKRISYTDFPLVSVELYFANGTILLPGEY